jgi:hypothetical protein
MISKEEVCELTRKFRKKCAVFAEFSIVKNQHELATYSPKSRDGIRNPSAVHSSRYRCPKLPSDYVLSKLVLVCE